MRFLAFVYRNSQAYAPGAKHVGLGVNAMHMVNVLGSHGVKCDCYAAHEIGDVTAVLDKLPADSVVVVEAIWVVTENWEKVLAKYPAMDFVVRCHSQVGFLQVEPSAIKLIREQIALQEHCRRFRLAGNSGRFTAFINQAYRVPCEHLPNLYTTGRTERKHPGKSESRTLRVGAFGALRHLKMHLTAGAAALCAARRLSKDLEFHITVGRDEGGGAVVAGLRYLFGSLPGVTLVEQPWLPWAEFRRLAAHMDVCVQVSATESFNLVTADAISEGTPCVVGPAIDWVPPEWVTDIDDPVAIGQKICAVLADHRSPELGIKSLDTYNNASLKIWMAFLASM